MGVVVNHLNDWDLDEQQARAKQRHLAGLVDVTPTLELPATAAGVDVAYDVGSDVVVAAVVILDSATLEVIETCVIRTTVRFPYVPGLLSFRELPSVIDALGKVEATPGVIVCDGHGYAHPERFGLASHLGVLCDIPTVGCAKTAFFGTYDEPGPDRGSRTPIVADDATIGHALRTQDGVNPVFVSPGHDVDFDSACEIVLSLAVDHRLPETTRAADQLGRRALAATDPGRG